MSGQKERWIGVDGDLRLTTLDARPAASSYKGTVTIVNDRYSITSTSNGVEWYSQGYSASLTDRPSAAEFGKGTWRVGKRLYESNNGTQWSSVSRHTHIKAALLGDSLTGRHRSGRTIKGDTAIGFWNWANWLIGAPFVFQNFGVSGDKTQSILSRISAIPHDTQVVFLMTGTNDVYGMSASANQATIDSTYTTVSGYIQSGINNLKSAGKIVVISTIIPNNAYSLDTDSRIQLLDRLNAFIATLAGPTVFVVDSFTEIWDAAQPTLRVCKAATMHSDGTHIAAAGSQLIGIAAMTAATSAFNLAEENIDLYQGYHLNQMLYSAFRTGTGGSAGTKTAGTGTLADGWRSINNAGSATFTLTNADAYSYSSNYVTREISAGIDEHWQTFDVTSAIANDNVRLQLGSQLTNADNLPDSVAGGDLFFAELDVWVANPVNLRGVFIDVRGFFTAGTSPADQPYMGSNYNSVQAGGYGDFSSSVYPLQQGYRALMRTPVLRIPENINNASAVTLQLFADIIFDGVGSATVKFGRPRIWSKSA